jgi:hypothetical protein
MQRDKVKEGVCSFTSVVEDGTSKSTGPGRTKRGNCESATGRKQVPVKTSSLICPGGQKQALKRRCETPD